MDRLLIEKAGEEQPEQVARYRSDGGLGGEVFAVQMIYASDVRVRGHQLICQFRDRKFHAVSIEHSRPKRKPADA
jgi:hypothetical protein